MRPLLTLVLGGVIALMAVNDAMAQQGMPLRQALQQIHSPASVDEELARLTKDMNLTATQKDQTRQLLLEHHDQIQALLDKNPAASRQDLGPQIHAISDTTHKRIDALLTDQQRQLEQQMQQRLRTGQEGRRPN
jgi:DNA anti-recombination protein RmuC